MGREKGFELWEEVGFYEGFARFWRALLVRDKRRAGMKEGEECAQPGRACHHITALEALIARFPITNPSDATSPTPTEEVDIAALMAQIRARYKALCASLGVKPRMAVAGAGMGRGRRLGF